ncbi:HMA domain-containing protein [Cephalotus follicularis]|uniref:HMA domain-containing protein n=1 Tax=Cephalotus follicularis TaxID=3775 RepID=A0A1Q3DBW8_CEPFO|nr:HMA domain-containing protein [Cephalotus follicularis]
MVVKVQEKKVDQVVTAVYKVNLHCRQCACEIKKPLIKTQGVHNVDVDMEKSEIKVKGVIDGIKIQKLIEKLSKKRVEFLSPQVQPKIKEKESVAAEKKSKETEEEIIRTTSIKVHLHCHKCEHDLRNKLLKHKDVYSVKTDMEAQTLTVQGSIESEKLLSYMRKKAHKHAEIMASKHETKKPEEMKEKSKSGESTSTAVVEFKEEVKVEVKTKESNTPYFIHYVYAPQLFSDENPNACYIM